MKKILVMLLALLLTAGCVKTKDPSGGAGGKPEDITVLGYSAQEKDLNVVRDQLTKNGFNVKLNIQPDFSSFSAQRDAGQYDLALTGWTTVTGNPDYAVRSIFLTGGDYNQQPLADPAIDALIEKAASETPDVFKQTYTEFEKLLVTENAYIVPMYSSLRLQAMNKNILDVSTIRQPKSRSGVWEQYSYVDKALNATRPLMMTQMLNSLTSMDPIKANDGSINTLNTNIYIRVINLSDEDVIEAKGSLSHNFAIADGNTEYYFLLRDDVNFASIKDKKAVDTGVMVSAEDVVFSLKRAMDKTSVPDHRTYSLHSSMKGAEIVTDLAELSKVESGQTTSVLDALSKGLPAPIASLTADSAKVDNAKGSYQVVKVTTNTAFPQVLNYLAHQSAGIVSKKQVESINTYDVSKYDPKKDIAYGDQSQIIVGATYNNHLWCSGPYAMTYKDEYVVSFEKNPGYMPGTENFPKIQTIVYKFIKDNDAALAALRSGDVDMLGVFPEDKLSVLEADPNLHVMTRSSNGVTYAIFNLKEGNKFRDVDLRKAVLYSINQDDFIATYNGLKNRSYSTVSTLVETGNKLVADAAKAQEHLKAYQAKQK